MRAEQVEIPVTVRSELGKNASRRLRARGQIPAVVYGKGADPLPLCVEEAVFTHLLHPRAWYSTLITLKVSGAERGRKSRPTVMIAEVQHDLVRRKVLSIDFKRISLQERIHTHVPVRPIGESPGMKKGGIVEQVMHEVMVECLPTDLPDHLEVRIGALEIGDSVRVRDLVCPAGVRALAPEDETVIVIAPPVREEVAPAAAAEAGALVEELPEPEVIGERKQPEE